MLRSILVPTLALVLAGCGAQAAAGPTPLPTSTIMKWSHPPKMTINPAHHYAATVATSDGTFTITLLPKMAPITVNNFIFLARHRFYNGVIFHRIAKGFVIQTGDPTGTGMGGPGYTIKDERVTMPYTAGIVAMANTGTPNTGGSQFFIVTAAHPKLGPSYTIFGTVTQGMNSTVRKIENTPVNVNPATGELSDPVYPPKIQRVVIHESA